MHVREIEREASSRKESELSSSLARSSSVYLPCFLSIKAHVMILE